MGDFIGLCVIVVLALSPMTALAPGLLAARFNVFIGCNAYCL